MSGPLWEVSTITDRPRVPGDGRAGSSFSPVVRSDNLTRMVILEGSRPGPPPAPDEKQAEHNQEEGSWRPALTDPRLATGHPWRQLGGGRQRLPERPWGSGLPCSRSAALVGPPAAGGTQGFPSILTIRLSAGQGGEGGASLLQTKEEAAG